MAVACSLRSPEPNRGLLSLRVSKWKARHPAADDSLLLQRSDRTASQQADTNLNGRSFIFSRFL